MVKDRKDIVIPILILVILVVLYEQLSAQKNVYIKDIASVVFMFGMMCLSSKMPSKN
jgi:hypothetical protein